jgi:hypothetical protein
MRTQPTTTLDVRALHPRWYSASDTPELVEFASVRGLGVTGQGEPGGPVYWECSQALYAVAGQVLALAAQAGVGLSMPVLEGRWWVEDDRSPFQVPREQWWWQLFLRLPDPVQSGWADQAREAAREAERLPAVSRVQLVTFTEGQCVQAMHHGPYADEPRTLALMEALMEQSGLVPNGLHHELYLSDVRETAPQKMRTILRQPVRAA